MRSTGLALAALLVSATATPGQVIREAHAQVLATVTGKEFLGGGLGFSVRPGGRLRLTATGSAGVGDGAFAFRAEILAGFLATPFRRSGLSLYGAGGAAVLWMDDGAMREFIVVALGLETAPWSAAGMFAELGAGGGLRLSAGVRIRGGFPRRGR